MDDPIEFTWSDQMGGLLLGYALVKSLFFGVIMSAVATAIGGLISLLVGGVAIPGDRLEASVLGFFLLAAFAAMFVFIGYLVPPRISIQSKSVLIGEGRELPLEEVRAFRWVRRGGWHHFEIDYGSASECGTVTFDVAIKPSTREKTGKLIDAIASQVGQSPPNRNELQNLKSGCMSDVAQTSPDDTIFDNPA